MGTVETGHWTRSPLTMKASFIISSLLTLSNSSPSQLYRQPYGGYPVQQSYPIYTTPGPVCSNVSETVCSNVEVEVCGPVTKGVCLTVPQSSCIAGEAQACTSVPTLTCTTEDKQACTTITTQECSEVPSTGVKQFRSVLLSHRQHVRTLQGMLQSMTLPPAQKQ